MNYLPLVLLAAGGIVLTAGDLIMRLWVKHGTWSYYLLGLLIYLIGMNFLAQSYRFRHIGVASGLIVIFNIVALTIISYFYFNDKINIYEGIGLVLAIVAVLLIELGGD